MYNCNHKQCTSGAFKTYALPLKYSCSFVRCPNLHR